MKNGFQFFELIDSYYSVRRDVNPWPTYATPYSIPFSQRVGTRIVDIFPRMMMTHGLLSMRSVLLYIELF
jgi:hypothetical protein